MILCAVTCGFAFHLIPGFHNPIIYNKIQVSPISSFFTMYFNFDKILAAQILFYFYRSYESLKNNKESLKISLKVLGYCIGTILLPAYLSNYIKFDPKLPNMLWVWSFNNLLCVAFSEEVIFRDVIQNTLKSFFNTTITFFPIFIASLAFGLYHFHIGKIFIILAILM